MSEKVQEAQSEKESLRVALDKTATQSFASMVDKIKTANPYVKIQPSQFVSFLISDYYATYFEKDAKILIAEFFDSQTFYEETLRLKNGESFESVMASALEQVRKIKGKVRRQRTRMKKTKIKDPAGIE